MIDASLILPHLYVGSYPAAGSALRRAGFRVLVLCAEELQPPADWFERVGVIRAPIDDAPLTTGAVRIVNAAAMHCSGLVLARRNVLVTCAEGRNRSALIAALTVHKLTRLSGTDCVQILRARRRPPRGGGVLTNHHFVRWLERRH